MSTKPWFVVLENWPRCRRYRVRIISVPRRAEKLNNTGGGVDYKRRIYAATGLTLFVWLLERHTHRSSRSLADLFPISRGTCLCSVYDLIAHISFALESCATLSVHLFLCLPRGYGSKTASRRSFSPSIGLRLNHWAHRRNQLPVPCPRYRFPVLWPAMAVKGKYFSRLFEQSRRGTKAVVAAHILSCDIFSWQISPWTSRNFTVSSGTRPVPVPPKRVLKHPAPPRTPVRFSVRFALSATRPNDNL